MSRSRHALLAVTLVALSVAAIAEEPATKQSQARATIAEQVGDAHPGPTSVRPAVSPPPAARPTPRAIGRAPSRSTAPPVAKVLPTPPSGSWGIVSSGDGGGGIFRDTDSEAEAWLGANGYGAVGFGLIAGGQFQDSNSSGRAYVAVGDDGIHASGTSAGGYFFDSDSSAYAWVGAGDTGIVAGGNEAGGEFQDSDGTSFAHVCIGDRGVEALGNEMGGYFQDLDGSGYSKVGVGDRGIEGRGTEMGGYFEDSDGSGYARLGVGDRGTESYGTGMGGHFEDTDGSGYAEIGTADRGIEAFGDEMGGHFKDSNSSGYSYVGNGDQGILSAGNVAGGAFHDLDDSGYAYVGHGDRGIEAYGDDMGGYFEESDGTGYAHVAVGNRGIEAFGANVGGYFEDTNSSAWSSTAYDTTKITGNGTVNFVQNHPFEHDRVIVYSAPEGDEVATYTRGTARLAGGEARVRLGETFKWVTNPDIGLTAFAMPIDHWCDLYVAEKGTEEIVVRTRDGSDCAFDYLVYGLRIGFEETTTVQEKTREAYIPSMVSHRDRASNHPDLAQHTALSRWTSARKALGDEEPPDLSRARNLRDLIQEYDPAVQGPLDSRRSRHRERAGSAEGLVSREPGGAPGDALADRLSTDGGAVRSLREVPGSDPGHDVYARSFRPSAAGLASLFEVSEPLEPGDVVVIDPERAGMMRRADTAADPTVIGVVAASPGVVLGMSDTGTVNEAAVAFAGVASCKVDAAYGPVYPGDLLVSSPTPGHAMRVEVPLPGTVLGKALEELPSGSGVIRVLVMPR